MFFTYVNDFTKVKFATDVDTINATISIILLVNLNDNRNDLTVNSLF